MDAIKGAYNKIASQYKAGNQETDSLGKELHARAEMTASALGKTAVPEAKPTGTASYPVDRVNGGDRGLKHIDTKEMTRPLGSFKDGCDNVPETGVYKLHKGEKVVPAHKNPDNDDKNAVEDAFMEHSPEEKAHFHRSMAKLHGGALHRHFGIPEDQPIPMEKKQEAAKSDNPHVAAMGRLAVAMHGWSHGKK